MSMPVEVVFDLETAEADKLYAGGHDGPFIRLAGAELVHDREQHLTTDPVQFAAGLARAGRIITHNGLAFDIPALCRHAGGDYDALTRDVVDTLVVARLADPPAAGHAKPWSTRGYYGLDQLAQRLGVAAERNASKGVLADLAKEFGGYDQIPPDDRRYRAYLRDDLSETRAVYEKLRAAAEAPYARREMRVVALQNRMTLNGWRVDVPLLAERVTEEKRRQTEAMAELHALGLPETGGVNPLASDAGKSWFAAGLERLGIDVPRTPVKANGSGGNVSVSGDNVKALAREHGGKHPILDRVLDAMQTVAGVSAKYQEIQNHLIGDRVHAGIGADQASGRWAMTRPSVTNIGKRGGKHVQRAPFLPEPGHVIRTFDLDQVDMRAIAALSQDPAYRELFLPGRDAHAEIAELVLGDRKHRESAKSIGHGWNYGEGPKKIALDKGIPLELAEQFDQMMTTRFPRLCEWREEIRARGKAGELLDNGFGRLMRCTPERAYTQAPALMGQGAARDIMCEGLLRLDPAVYPMLRAVVHDEVVLSIPERQVREVSAHVVDAFTWTFNGVRITCGASRPGANWAACYEK